MCSCNRGSSYSTVSTTHDDGTEQQRGLAGLNESQNGQHTVLRARKVQMYMYMFVHSVWITASLVV